MSPSLEKPADPAGAPATPETREPQAQNPETILGALKKRAENAVTSEEREKFQKLADKLAKTLVAKSEHAVDGTKDALAEFRAGLSPEQKKMLQDAETALKTGAGKIGDVARGTMAQAQETGAKVFDAVKSGDMKEVKKLADGIVEKTNEAGQKIREYSGVAALEKLIESLKTEGFAGILAVLANFWRFLTGGMKWSEVMGGAQAQAAGAVAAGTGAVAAGTAAAQAAAGKVETAMESFRKMSPEELEKLTEKMADGIADDLSQKYLGGAKLSPEKIKKIREIVSSSKMNPEELQKISKKIQENGKITVENIAEILGTVSAGATELMWKIAFSGIVPLKHIAYEAVTGGSKTAVGLTFYGLGLPPMTMSIEEIHALISKHSATGGEKAMSLVQLELYRPLGVFWAVTSGIIANIAKLGIAVGADTASGANGLPVLRWLTGVGGDYQTVFKEFELINQKFASLPNNPHTQGMSKIIEELKTGMNAMTKNWKIIAILDEVKYDQAKFLAHPELSKIMDASEIVKIKQAPNFQAALKDIVGAPPARSLQFNNARMFFGNGDGVVQKYLRDMDNARWFQNLLVSSDKGGIEKLNRLRDYVNTMKLIRQGDTVLLHLEDAKDVKNFQALRKLLAVLPEGIRWLGSILPAGAFVVTMSKAVSDEATTSSEIIESLKSVLVPMVGGWQLIKNVGVNFEDLKNGKLPTMSDAGVAALGMTIMTFEGIRISSGLYEGVVVQAFKHGDIKWAARTVAKTAFMHPIDIAKSVGYMSRGAMHISKAAPAVYSQAAKQLMKIAEKMPKKWRLALLLATWIAATAAGAAILEKKDHLELESDLKKQGYIDAKWDLTPKFYAEFQEKDDVAKSAILHDLFWAIVDTSDKRPKVHFDAKAREFAIVTSKAEEKSWWQSVLDSDTSFRDQLTRMGIDVLVIPEEDIAKPVEKRREKVASNPASEAK